MINRPTQLSQQNDPWIWSDHGESIVDECGDGVEEADDSALDENGFGGFRFLSVSQFLDEDAIGGVEEGHGGDEEPVVPGLPVVVVLQVRSIVQLLSGTLT